MPKRIIIFTDEIRDKFIDSYQARNEFGYVHTIADLQRIFKITQWTLRKITKKAGLSRNKRRDNEH